MTVQMQKAIQYLKEQKREYGTPSIFADYCDLAIECIEKQFKTDWIPCEERLPETDEDVLVQDEFGNILVYSLSWVQTEGNYGKRVWEDEYGYWHEFDEVIAWQPLPQPYKESE